VGKLEQARCHSPINLHIQVAASKCGSWVSDIRSTTQLIPGLSVVQPNEQISNKFWWFLWHQHGIKSLAHGRSTNISKNLRTACGMCFFVTGKTKLKVKRKSVKYEVVVVTKRHVALEEQLTGVMVNLGAMVYLLFKFQTRNAVSSSATVLPLNQ